MPGKFILLFALGVSNITVRAQNENRFTLQQCIDTALRNNIAIRQAKLMAEAADIHLQQARISQLPTVYAAIDQALNLGRNIDPYTNGYVNQTIGYGTTALSGDMVIYNGSNIRNTIRQSEMTAIAGNAAIQQNNNQVRLNVLLAYLNVLSTEEQLAVANSQATLSSDQLKRMELKKNKGVAAVSEVADLKGQLLNDSLAIVDLQNTLKWNKMELCQQMNIAYDKNMTLETKNIEEPMSVYQQTSEDIYMAALNNFPGIKVAEWRTKAAEFGLKAAKGLRYPLVSAGSMVSTVYTSSANIIAQKVAFSNQFINNRTANFYLNIRIPIFVQHIKNDIRLADINLRNAALVEEQTKIQVQQQIERAYVAMTNAYTRYKTLLSQLDAYATSFKAAQAKFETGVDVSTINYLVAKNNLSRANTNLIIARYDFILRAKTLDFYRNGLDPD